LEYDPQSVTGKKEKTMFLLKINLEGICVYFPEIGSDGKRGKTHVVLVDAWNDTQYPHEAHLTVLRGVIETPPSSWPIELKQHQLTIYDGATPIEQLGTQGADLRTDGYPNLSTIPGFPQLQLKQGVDRSQAIGNVCAARLLLCGGTLEPVQDRITNKVWQLEPEVETPNSAIQGSAQYISQAFRYQRQMAGDSMKLQLQSPHAGSSELVIRPQDGVVRIDIKNMLLLSCETPLEVNIRNEATHFKLVYKLYTSLPPTKYTLRERDVRLATDPDWPSLRHPCVGGCAKNC
jgi:hypothetical protein